MSETSRVFVHNLPYNYEKRDIEDLFKGCGRIEDIDIMRQRDGTSRGICILTFESKGDAEEAIDKVSNQRVDGRLVTCREDRGSGYVHPQSKRDRSRPKSGGRGGRDRSRGRGGRDRSGGRRDRSRGRSEKRGGRKDSRRR